MATTQWTADSGDWTAASNWSGGVPGTADDAVFSQLSRYDTVTGSGAASSISATGTGSVAPMVTFAGTHAVGSLLAEGAVVILAGTAALSAGSVTLESVAWTDSVTVSGTAVAVSGDTEAVLRLEAGASLAAGTITLKGGELDALDGELASPVFVSVSDFVQVATQFDPAVVVPDTIDGHGTLSGVLAGPGVLQLGYGERPADGNTPPSGGSFVLDNPGDVLPGGLRLDGARVTLTGGQTVGAVLAASGTLTLGAGVAVGPITAAMTGTTVVDATDQDLAVFAGVGELDLHNGSGHATVIGAVAPGQTSLLQEGQTGFGVLSVTGGTGNITVFAGNSQGAIFGGTAGGNVILAGADLSAFTHREFDGRSIAYNGLFEISSGPVTIGGGGDGDLLVVTGDCRNVVAAAGGNETLTGSTATNGNVFFGGSGADVIVAGGGQDLVVAGAGTETISGGAGGTAIFAGAGSDLILGGAGADYVQAGSGAATLFAGAGADLVGVVAGQAGGSLLVSGFRVGTDHVAARGYAGAPAIATAGGNTVLSFSDHTRVTLLGVATLPGSAFV